VTTRAIAILWLVVGGLLWNGIFDLYVSRGVREYLQLRAEAEQTGAPAPSIPGVMARSTRMGVTAASLWAGAVVTCGWLTIVVAGRARRTDPAGQSSRKRL
jgi:hypothetical protein